MNSTLAINSTLSTTTVIVPKIAQSKFKKSR